MMDHFNPTPLDRQRRYGLFLMLVVLMMLTAFSHARQTAAHAIGTVEGEDWLYPLGQAETLESVGRRYLQPPRLWVDLVRYNLLDDAFSLLPGTIIRLPLSWLRHTPRPAVLTAFDGSVWIYRHSALRPHAGRAGDALKVGDRIRVIVGTADIRFEDGSTLRLGKQSDLDFNQMSYYGDSGMVDTRLRLRQGRVKSDVRDRVGPKGRYEIQTREVTTTVMGTSFVLEQTATDTRVEVHSGVVALGRQGHETIVRSEHGALISALEGVTAKLLPRIGGLIISRGRNSPEMPLAISWSDDPSRGFTRYRITHRPAASSAEVPRLLEAGRSLSNRVTLSASDDGVYGLLLQAVDHDGFHGVPQHFEFRIDSKAPQQIELKLSGMASSRVSL